MKKLSILFAALVVALPLQAATKTVVFDVNGWTCGSCAGATRIALKKLDGVADVKTDDEKKEALVTYDDAKVTTDRMVQAIAKLGYKATVRNGAATSVAPPAQVNAPSIAAKGASTPADRVSFFEVPLECGAAENLGCGSEAKPILNELDRDARIAEARINHPGTLLAVVWKNPSARSDSAVEAVFDKNHLAAATLRGAAREKALKEFRSEPWYSAADVDRLSEREAQVISARLVKRARFDLPPDRIASLTEDLAVVFARHLKAADELCDTTRDVIMQELTKAASKHLNPEQMAQLKESGDQGIHALPGENK